MTTMNQNDKSVNGSSQVGGVASGKGACGDSRVTIKRNPHEVEALNISKQTVTIGTWNVRTLWQTGQLQILTKVMESYRYDVVGISEVRWTGSGDAMGGRFLYSGEESRHEKGVCLLMNARAQRALMWYDPVSPRIIVARFEAYPRKITAVQV